MNRKIRIATTNYHGFLENSNHSHCIVMVGRKIRVETSGSISTSCCNRTKYNSVNSLQMLKEEHIVAGSRPKRRRRISQMAKSRERNL